MGRVQGVRTYVVGYAAVLCKPDTVDDINPALPIIRNIP